MEPEEDNRPLDEILSELLWRIYHLKKKALDIQQDKSLTKRILRWISRGRK